jgi:sulfide:quinone oxidoreductase
VEVELLAPEHHFFYRPLAVAEPFDAGRVHRWELDDLARAAGAQFTPGALERIDARSHVAETDLGLVLEYDAVMLACGATPHVAVPGALTFRGPADVDALRDLLDEVARGEVERVVFAVPSGTVWPLPLYEVALLAAAQLGSGRSGASLELVTSEPAPLALFGARASEAVGALLDDHGIEVRTSTYAVEVTGDGLATVRGGTIAADRVVALPRLRGREIEGVPSAGGGFVPTDPHGRVRSVPDVYAAGDLTTFPIKQGGLAAQQADAAAETIAAGAGAGNEPRPFEPVLRALLLTGGEPAFLRVELGGGHGESSKASSEPLWWPPGKIVGRYLAPFLADLGLLALPTESVEDALRVELEATAVHELGSP